MFYKGRRTSGSITTLMLICSLSPGTFEGAQLWYYHLMIVNRCYLIPASLPVAQTDRHCTTSQLHKTSDNTFQELTCIILQTDGHTVPRHQLWQLSKRRRRPWLVSYYFKRMDTVRHVTGSGSSARWATTNIITFANLSHASYIVLCGLWRNKIYKWKSVCEHNIDYLGY